jgi:hypothetical protein
MDLCFRIGRLVLFEYRRIGISGLSCRGAFGGLNFPLLGERKQDVLTPARTLSDLVILLLYKRFIRF